MTQQSDVVDINKYRDKRQLAFWLRRGLVLVFLVACLFAGYFFSRSSLFNVKSIEISGSTHADFASLCELSGYTKGNSIFSVSPGSAEAFLRISPWVKSAQVRLKLPNVVRIVITERRPAALLSVDGAVLCIDGEGRVLERCLTTEGLNVPFVTGLDLSDCGTIAGSRIYAEGIDAALAVLAQLPDDAAEVGEINVSNIQDIRLYLLDDTEIRLGDSSQLAEKYLVFSNILQDVRDKDKQTVHYIDVSIVSWPVFK